MEEIETSKKEIQLKIDNFNKNKSNTQAHLYLDKDSIWRPCTLMYNLANTLMTAPDDDSKIYSIPGINNPET